jgi:hypothetical protein
LWIGKLRLFNATIVKTSVMAWKSAHREQLVAHGKDTTQEFIQNYRKV